MKNSSDTIGNRTRDLPTCSAVPQPTALPRASGPVLTGYEVEWVQTMSSRDVKKKTISEIDAPLPILYRCHHTMLPMLQQNIQNV